MRFFRSLMPLFAALIVVLPFVGAASANDDYSTWGNWRYVYLITKTAAPGANVTTTQTNFPVLIRLNPGNFDGLGNAADDGSDIRFSTADGTHLYYQLERWQHTSSTIDTAEFWVLAPSVTGNDTTKLKMYWNKSGAADSSLPGKVFDIANGFAGVWHLTNSSFNDATSNNFTAVNSGTTDTAAVIGTGRKFVGSHPDYLQVTGLMGSPAAVTLSCWAKVDSIDGATYNSSDIISMGDNVTMRAFRNGGGTRDSLYAQYYSGSWNGFHQPGGAGIVLKQGWKYLTLLFNPGGSSQLIYINATQVASASFASAISYSQGSNTFFGKHGNNGNNDFGGVLDEVRIDKTNRSADWIKLCYQNQRQTNGRDSLVWYSSSSSENYTWDNSTSSNIQAGSGTWGTDSYWTADGGGTVLTAWPGGGNATFAGSDGGPYTITINGTQNVDSIAFLNSGYTLSGGTAVNLGASSSILVASLKTAAISTPITTTGGLAKYGAGTLTLSGANTFTSGVTVSAGTLQIGAGSTAGAISNSSNITDNATLIFNRSDAYSYTGLISGTGAVTQAGGGTTTLSNANTYTGTTTISAGTLTVQGVAFSTTPRTWSISSGAVLNIDGNTGVATGTTILNGTGTLRVTGGTFGNETPNAPAGTGRNITMSLGSGALIDVQSGATMLNGGWQNITWTANLADLNVDGTFNLWDGNPVTVDALTGAGTVTKGMAGTVVLTVGANNGSGTFGGIINNTNTSALTKTGTGTQTLTGANTYTGATTISAGTLSIGGGGATGAISNTSNVTDNATLTFNRSNAYTYTGTISGSGAVIKTGAGTTTLSGTNTYNGAGGTTVNAGVLQAGSAQPFGNVGNAITVNNGGAIDLNTRDLRGYTSNITINGSLDATTGCIFNSGTYSATQGLVRQIALGSDASIGANTAGKRFDIGRGYTGATRITGNSHTLTKVGAATDTVDFLGQSTGVTSYVITGGCIQFEDNLSFGTSPITINSGGALIHFGTRSITNNLTMSSGKMASNTGTGTYSGTVALTGTNTFEANSIVLSGAVSGSGGLTMSGAGTLTLSNTGNSYAGDNTVSSGTLKLGASGVIPDGAGKGNVSLTGTLDLTSYSETINGLSGAGTVTSTSGTPTLTVGSNDQTTTFSGVIQNGSGTTALTKQGTGTQTLSGANTYTGTTTISAGTLSIGAGGTTGAISNSSAVTDNATLIFNRSDAYTYSGVISSTGAVRVDAGVVTLSSATGNTYSGGTTISSGTLMVTNTSGSGTGTGSVTVNSGGTLSGTGIVSGAVTVNDGGAIQPTLVGASGGTLTLSSSTDPVFNATTTLTIRTPSSTVDKVSLTGGGAAFTASNVALNIDATGLTGVVTGATIVQVTKGNGIVGGFASVTANNNYNVTVHYASKAITIDLEPGKYFAGTGTWNATNTNWSPFPGGPYIYKFNGGNDAFFESPAGTVTLSSPNNPLSVTFLIDGYTLTSGTITLAGPAITAGAGINAAINSVIAGSVGLNKAGAGGLSLGGTNTFTCGATLSAGTLNINNASALGNPSGTFTITGGTINNTSGGAVTVSGNNPQAWNGSFTFTGSYALNLGTGAVTLGASPTVTVSAGTLTSGGVISGSYGLTKAGTGTLALSGANTFTGGVTVSAGTLKLGAAGVIPDGPTAGNVSVTGTLDLNSFSETINGLSGAGTVDNTAAGTPTLTVGNNGATSTFSGTINNTSGTMALAKTGTGTFTLSNTGTQGYTGVTTVSNGTLNLGGSISGNLTLQSGARCNIGGSGATNICNIKNLDIQSGSTFAVEINGTSAGTNYDQAGVIGTLTLGGNLSITLGFAPAAGNKFTIISNDGTGDAVSGTFNGLTEGATITADFGGTMYPFTISYLGTAGGDNDVVLTALAVGTLKSWTGGAAGNNWSNGGAYTANWSPAQIPISGDIVVFSSAATAKRTTGTTDIAALTISLSITNIAAACAIASGGSQPFTLNSSGVDMSTATANDFTINQAFSLGASQSFNVKTAGRTLNLNAAITNGAYNLTITGAGNVTTNASGVLGSGAGGLTMSGTGTLTLAASNTYTGVTTFNSGTISGNSFANGGTACAFGQASNAAASFVFNSGTLTYTGDSATPDRSFTLYQGGGTINSSGTGALSLGTGAPALIYSGSGTRNLTLGGTYTGADNTFGFVLADNGGATSLTKNGTGTWIINQTNTYTGATTITLGTLKCGAASVIASSSQVSISTSASTVFNLNNNNQSIGSLTGGGSGGGNISLGSATLTIGGDNLSPAAYAGQITGTGGLTKTGTGTLTLNSANATYNTYIGVTTISGGTHSAAKLASGGANSDIGAAPAAADNIVLDGGTLKYTGGVVSIDRLFTITSNGGSIDGSGSGALTMASGGGTIAFDAVASARTLTLTGSTADNIFDGILSDPAGAACALSKTGSGSWRLSRTNTYSGNTTISAGTLRLNIGSAIPDGANKGNVVMNPSSSATLDLGGFSETINGLSSSGAGSSVVNNSVAGGPYTLTVGGNDQSGTFGGVIKNTAGTLALVKSGSGTLTLSGANTYAGTTTVSNGTLLVTGSTFVGAVTVQSGATLGGTGTIGGALTVNSGGTVQPTLAGSSGGTLAFSSFITPSFASTSTLKIRAPSSTLDKVSFTDVDAIFTAGNIALVIDATGLSGEVTGAVIVSVAMASGGISGTFASVTANNGYNATVHYNTQTITVDLSQVSVGTFPRTAMGAINGGAAVDAVMYVGTTTSDRLYCLNISDGTNKWSYTSTHGGVKNPTYTWDGSNYIVMAAATDYVIALRDDGGSYTERGWSPLSLAGAGTPYISADNATFFVPYTGNLSRRDLTTGAQTHSAAVNIASTADIAVSGDFVFVGTTGGEVKRYDAGDLTNLQTYTIPTTPSVNLPMLMNKQTLYVTPANGSLYAINKVDMSLKWSKGYSQGGTNTGPAYKEWEEDTTYTAVGNYVYKIAGGVNSATEMWTPSYYNAGSTVNSGPIWYNGTVYFGTANGYYHAIKKSDGTVRAGWPMTTASGNASAGPWIDMTNGKVIFGTTGGNLDAFTLEP